MKEQDVDNTEQPWNVLSLCTGMRGLEAGIERIGVRIRTVAYVEIEAFVCENLVRQMERGVLAPAPVWTNVKTFPSEEFYGKIHGITGGYPCQPFSVAGKRGGEDDPRHLWPHIKRMVGAVRPVWCFFENVPGHLSLGYREVRSDLEELGYAVEEGIFSAEEVGAPHQRKRLFILAVQVGYARQFAKGREEGRFGSWEFSDTQRVGAKEGDRPTDTSSLGNTSSDRLKPHNEVSTRRDGIESSGEELEHHTMRGRKEFRESITSEQKNSRPELPGNSKLANTTEQRVERNRSKGEQESEISAGEEILGRNSGADRWPARPGEEQYAWECPRVEEKDAFTCVGGSASGYNFREDLLRLLGNAVVEQTAQKAWVTLWNKMGERIC